MKLRKIEKELAKARARVEKYMLESPDSQLMYGLMPSRVINVLKAYRAHWGYPKEITPTPDTEVLKQFDGIDIGRLRMIRGCGVGTIDDILKIFDSTGLKYKGWV